MSTTTRLNRQYESPTTSSYVDGEDVGDTTTRLDFVSATIIGGVLAFCVIMCMIIGCRRKKRSQPPRFQDITTPTVDQSRSETDGATNLHRETGATGNRSQNSRGDDSPPPTYSIIERQTSFTSTVSQTSSMIEVPPMYDEAWDDDLDTSGQSVGRSVSARRPRWSQRHAGSAQSQNRAVRQQQQHADRSSSFQHSRPPRARSHRFHSDGESHRRIGRPGSSRPTPVSEQDGDAADIAEDVDDVHDDDVLEPGTMDVIAEVTPRSSETELSAEPSDRAETQSIQPLLRDAATRPGGTSV